MTDWETVTDQQQPGSDGRGDSLIGAFTLEDGDTWLTTDDGKRYRLPGAPEELSEGERIQVWLNRPPVEGSDLEWASITSPPTSGPEEVFVGSTSIRVVPVEEVEARIGEPPTPTPPAHTHVVQKGETLRMIAEQYDVTVEDLREANDDVNASGISVGQALLIPDGSGGKSAAPATATSVPMPTAHSPFDKGTLMVNRIELVYYLEPTAPYPATSPDGTPLTPEPVGQLVQPVWVFHGHDQTDTVRFTAYVQAAADDLIRDTAGAAAATPTPSR